jgi:hypothetical protein
MCGTDRLLRIDNNAISHDNIIVEMERGENRILKFNYYIKIDGKCDFIMHISKGFVV